MALKDIFKMTKANRYTADGREELIKAQEAITEDIRPANGIYHWKSGDYRKEGDKYVKIGPGTGGAGAKKPDGKSGSAEKHAAAIEHAKKVGVVSKVPEGWKKAEGVTTTPKGYVAITNGGSHFPKEGQQKREIKFIKEEDFNASKPGLKTGSLEEMKKEVNSPEARKNYDDFMKNHKKREFQELYGDVIKFDDYGLPSKETVELKNNFLRKKGISDPNKLSNKEFNNLAKELDDLFGINNFELSQELLIAEDSAPRILTGDTRIRVRK